MRDQEVYAGHDIYREDAVLDYLQSREDQGRAEGAIADARRF
jgi:hypothetical protein